MTLELTTTDWLYFAAGYVFGDWTWLWASYMLYYLTEFAFYGDKLLVEYGLFFLGKYIAGK